MGEIQQHNGPLLTIAMKIHAKKLPGESVNGSFTHPSMLANAIAATLEAAKKPLTEGQAAALEKAAREWSDADAKRLAGYGDGTYYLQRLAEEAEVRQRFLDAVFAFLTEEQRDALSPAAVRGRVQLDVFSSGLVWTAHVVPLVFHDRPAIEAQVDFRLKGLLGLSDDQRTALAPTVRAWVAELPAAWTDSPADPLSQHGLIDAWRAIESAKRQVVLLTRVVDALRLDDAGARKARDAKPLWAPVRAGG
jgi:hypothetical protein